MLLTCPVASTYAALLPANFPRVKRSFQHVFLGGGSLEMQGHQMTDIQLLSSCCSWAEKHISAPFPKHSERDCCVRERKESNKGNEKGDCRHDNYQLSSPLSELQMKRPHTACNSGMWFFRLHLNKRCTIYMLTEEPSNQHASLKIIFTNNPTI